MRMRAQWMREIEMRCTQRNRNYTICSFICIVHISIIVAVYIYACRARHYQARTQLPTMHMEWSKQRRQQQPASQPAHSWQFKLQIGWVVHSWLCTLELDVESWQQAYPNAGSTIYARRVCLGWMGVCVCVLCLMRAIIILFEHCEKWGDNKTLSGGH